MIALDTNILVRYLVRDDEKQAEAARTLLESLTIEQPGFVCREVIVELVWVLERSYKCSRDRIATVLEQLATTESLETGNDVICRCPDVETTLTRKQPGIPKETKTTPPDDHAVLHLPELHHQNQSLALAHAAPGVLPRAFMPQFRHPLITSRLTSSASLRRARIEPPPSTTSTRPLPGSSRAARTRELSSKHFTVEMGPENRVFCP